VRYRFAGSNRSEFEDVSEALQLARQAAGMYTGRHPLRLAAQNNLVGPLLLLFEIHQSPAYLEEAIEIATEVLDGRNRSNTHSDRLSSLHNLATLLLKSTGFHYEDNTMQRATSMQTVDSAPSRHPLRSHFYEHLAIMLWARYERSKESRHPQSNAKHRTGTSARAVITFYKPFDFIPERYLGKDGKLDPSVPDPEIAAFGHGRRCATIFPVSLASIC
jgi:hypothetical protein